MSKLRRSLARRDKALELLNVIENADEDKRPLNVPNLQLKIVNDISASSLHLPDEPLSYEWETIGIIVRISALLGDTRFGVADPKSYIPHGKSDQWLMSFREK